MRKKKDSVNENIMNDTSYMYLLQWVIIHNFNLQLKKLAHPNISTTIHSYTCFSTQMQVFGTNYYDTPKIKSLTDKNIWS